MKFAVWQKACEQWSTFWAFLVHVNVNIYIWAKVKHLDICEPLSAEIKRKISTHLYFIHQDVSLNNAVLTSYMALVSTREKSLWQP